MTGAFSSPDALAGKMPWLSPYAFCGGDPINYVDPTGMDTWGINHSGEIEYHIKQKYDEQIILVDKIGEDGKPLSTSFQYKTIELKQRSVLIGNNSETRLLRFDVAATPDGFNAYKFLASNTNVEWSLMDTEYGCIMTTSNNTSSEGAGAHVATAFASKGIGISIHIHSHPSNTMEPSGMSPEDNSGDVKFAQSIDKRSNNPVEYYIFIPKNQSLIQYSGNSVPSDFTPENTIFISTEDFIKKLYAK